jgi:1-acyl-sn-glycerol-3-phosphate acyltransferase
MYAFFRSLWVWFAISLLLILWLPLLAVIRLFDRDPVRYRTGRWFRRVGVMMTKVVPTWRFHVVGADTVTDPRRPYVVVSNHQSFADIPIISRLPWEMKWVAKQAVFKVPFGGWMMRLAGDIEVKRDCHLSRGGVLPQARWYLDRHCSVMFFPEGTRSHDALVSRFHDGAFRLAIEAQAPVLPLALDGTMNCLPKHSWILRGISDIRLQVLPPVETKGLTDADIGALRDRVRQMIMRQVAAWRGVDPAEVDGGKIAKSEK